MFDTVALFFCGGGGGRERHFLCGDIQVIKSRPL